MKNFICSLFLAILPIYVSAESETKMLSIEEKVGQLLMVHFQGEAVNEEARCLIQEAHVGGIIYYPWANGLDDPKKIRALSCGLQQLARKIPLLIAVDQEGGAVIRLSKGFTPFPGAAALGACGDAGPAYAEAAAAAVGQQLTSVGINMNFAPVVDINSNPKNPVIGIRSFGSDSNKVTVFGFRSLKGYHRANVAATLKHFPGHGDTSVDSHEKLPIVVKSRLELEACELLPFAALAKKAPAIMTAHILLPALDSEHCATLSEKILGGVLRKQLGFQGVIISDSLIMDGLLTECPNIEEIALRALEAGCDILLLGGKALIGHRSGFELNAEDVLRIHKYLVDAVNSGKISIARLDESVNRVLALKNRFAILEQQNNAQFCDNDQLRDLATHIAQDAQRVIYGDERLPIESQGKKLALFFPQSLQAAVDDALAHMKWEGKVLLHSWQGSEPDAAEIEKLAIAAESADIALMLCYNAWRWPNQRQLASHLAKGSTATVLLACGSSTDICHLPEDAAALITTESPDGSSLKAAFIKAILN